MQTKMLLRKGDLKRKNEKSVRLPENIELKVREVFDMMDLSGNKKVNENEFVKFIAKAGNGPEGQKLSLFMSSKKEVNLD